MEEVNQEIINKVKSEVLASSLKKAAILLMDYFENTRRNIYDQMFAIVSRLHEAENTI
jgi:hypothetical protein